MATDWRAWVRGSRFSIDGSEIGVRLGDGRKQVVRLDHDEERYTLVSVVLGRARVDDPGTVAMRAFRRNKSGSLVGFRLDAGGRLVGEASIPKAGLTQDEFREYLMAVAAECDRFEYELTGNDHE